MPEPTRYEANRKIAEWLGLGTQWGHDGMHHGNGTPDCPKELHHHHDQNCVLPDFYTDEAANAMVLDKLMMENYASLSAQVDGGDEEPIRVIGVGVHIGGVTPAVYRSFAALVVSLSYQPGFNPWTFAEDRKTAICEAALKFIGGWR